MISSNNPCIKAGLVFIFAGLLSCTPDESQEISGKDRQDLSARLNLKDPKELKELSKYSVYQTNFMVGADAYTFNADVVLRMQDDFGSDTVAVLKRDTRLSIEELASSDSTGTVHDFWYKVKTSGKEGFVWGRDLALIRMPLESDSSRFYFSYGLSEYGEKGHAGKGILLKDTVVIQELDIAPIQASDEKNYSYDVYGSICENPGFNGVRNLIRMSMGFGACGYEYGDILVFWDGNKLFKGPSLVGMYDAGFYYSHPYVFYPKDSSGLKDKIVVKQLSEEVVDEEDEEFEEALNISVYSWTPGIGIGMEEE